MTGVQTCALPISTTDVVVINSRPHVADKLDIGYDSLHELNPRLIYCSVTGFGPDGPYAERPAFDHVGQALSGWMSRHRQDSDPRVVGPAIADRVTGFYAALGILSALHERHKSGVGRLVEVNMLEANIALCMEPIVQYFASAKAVPIHLRGAFSQAYSLTCKDGRRIGLHMSSPDKFWHGLCRVLGRQDWIQTYPKHSDRVKAYEFLATELNRVFQTRERAEWAAALERESVPFAPEHEVQDLEDDPQIRHLGVFYQLDHPQYGAVKMARRPVHVDSSRDIDSRPPPGLGEHSEEILREAGLSRDHIERLRKSGII